MYVWAGHRVRTRERIATEYLIETMITGVRIAPREVGCAPGFRKASSALQGYLARETELTPETLQ